MLFDCSMQRHLESPSVAAHLFGAIQFPTLFAATDSGAASAVTALHNDLARTYPFVHTKLLRESSGMAVP